MDPSNIPTAPTIKHLFIVREILMFSRICNLQLNCDLTNLVWMASIGGPLEATH